MSRQMRWFLLGTSAIVILIGCGHTPEAVPSQSASQSPSQSPSQTACTDTPAQNPWPEVYGRARGEKDIWLVDNGAPHGPGGKRKVGWRVVGAVDGIDVKGKQLDGSDTFALAVEGRVMPNGQDDYPAFSDFVSYLTIPSVGCWTLSLKAGQKQETITLNVR